MPEAPRSVAAGRSALTPSTLYASSEAFPRTRKEYDDYRDLTAHQRSDLLDGFTVDELDDLFAKENPDAKPSSLHEVQSSVAIGKAPDISISPVLQRKNWHICIPKPDPKHKESVVDPFESSYFRDLNHLQANPVQLALRPKIYGTTNGYMDSEYEPVWNAMLPAIRLASRVLFNMHCSIL